MNSSAKGTRQTRPWPRSSNGSAVFVSVVSARRALEPVVATLALAEHTEILATSDRTTMSQGKRGAAALRLVTRRCPPVRSCTPRPPGARIPSWLSAVSCTAST
jgi:hypothetical protein